MPKDDKTMILLARISQKISSSYDLRETLSAYAGEGGFQTGGWLALMDAAKGISSSYDLRETLVEFADHMPRNDQLVSKYHEVLKNIHGNYDREQAEQAL